MVSAYPVSFSCYAGLLLLTLLVILSLSVFLPLQVGPGLHRGSKFGEQGKLCVYLPIMVSGVDDILVSVVC